MDQALASPIPAKGARQNQAGFVQCGRLPPPESEVKILNGIKKKLSKESKEGLLECQQSLKKV